MGCHFFLQEIFPTQGLNPSLLQLLHWQAVVPLSYLGMLYVYSMLKWEKTCFHQLELLDYMFYKEKICMYCVHYWSSWKNTLAQKHAIVSLKPMKTTLGLFHFNHSMGTSVVQVINHLHASKSNDQFSFSILTSSIDTLDYSLPPPWTTYLKLLPRLQPFNFPLTFLAAFFQSPFQVLPLWPKIRNEIIFVKVFA